MEIEVRTLAIAKNSWALEVLHSYEKKISYFNPIQLKALKNEKDFLKGVGDKDFIVICDERGKSFTSKQFAQQLEKILESGKKKIYFFIGGPFGLPDEIKAKAQLQINLSSLVFNQELALVVLFEQIFRAMTLINNHPYHNE